MSEKDFNCSNCGMPTVESNALCADCQPQLDATVNPTPNHFADATIAPAPASSTGLIPNKPVGDYDLIEEIARGGMGVVYKANHRNLNRITALKMILGGRFSSNEELQRFQVEAESAAKLDHPAIIPIFEIGECDGQAFFAMKYVEGGSLADRAASFKSRPREAAELMIKVAEAVHHAHQRGVLHRDLKPANILMDHEDQPYVTDLGLAKSTAGGSDLTHTGAVLGTPRYMPPEQASGKVVTTAADVYALGAILYELIVGVPPYHGENSMSVVIQVIDGPPKLPSKVNSLVDRDLELICLKCLNRDPDQRYFSAQSMAEDLQSWLDGRVLSVRPPSIKAKFTSWLKQNQRLANAALAIFLGVLLCAPLVMTFFSNNLAMAYDQFPREDRPWMYSIWVPNLVSFLFAIVLFLIIWPSIGLLNAIVSKPVTLFRSLTSGIQLSAILSLIFYVSVGWMIIIQGINNYQNQDVAKLADAIWPADDSSQEDALKQADELFGGLQHIPRAERAKVVKDRFEADRYASFPYSLGIALVVVTVFAVPIIYGTIVAYSLGRRKLPTWLFLLRYLIAWWAISMLLLSSFLTAMTWLSNSVMIQSQISSLVLGFGIIILAIFLSLRRWKKEPELAR